MPTLRERIVDEIVTLLNTSTPGGVPVAKRSYTFTIDAAASNSIIVYPKSDQAIIPSLAPQPVTRRSLVVVIECRAKSTASERPDAEADALASWVVKALCGRRQGPYDANGPLYHAIVEGETTFEMEQADHGYALVTVEVVVQYQSRANDPETWA